MVERHLTVAPHQQKLVAVVVVLVLLVAMDRIRPALMVVLVVLVIQKVPQFTIGSLAVAQ